MGLQNVITVVDQFGNPVWGVPARLGLRGSLPLNDPHTFEEKHVDHAGHVHLEFAGRGYCAHEQLDFPLTLWTVHVNYNEGFNPDWKSYTASSLDLDSSASAGQTVVLQRTGAPPSTGLTPVVCIFNSVTTGLGTCAEWKSIVHAIVAKLPAGAIMEPDRQSGGNGQQPNLAFVDAEVRKIDPRAKLQRSSGGEFKPRFFPPSDKQDGSGPPESPCGEFSRPIDMGSFGLPFFHDRDGHTDVWQLTGRPPDSKW